MTSIAELATAYQSLQGNLACCQQENAALKAELTKLQQKETALQEQVKAAQEQVAQLAKANEALCRTTTRLVNESDLNAYLGYVLLEASTQLGAVAAHLTIFNPERRTLSTAALVSNGQVGLPTFATEIPVETGHFFDIIAQRRQPQFFDLDTQADLFWPGTVEFHCLEGHRTVASVPLFLEEQPIGHIGLAFHDRELRFTEHNIELLQALSQQATLSIQLARLAEEAKQAAIAREQEKAASLRAVELAKANAVLKRMIDVLATKPELDAFLGQALVTITEQLGAPLSTLWFYDAQDVARLHMVYQNGQALLAAQSGFPEAVRSHRTRRDTIKWQTLFVERRPYVIDVANDPALEPIQREYILSQGMKMMVTFPLVLGDDLIGFFSIRLLESRQFRPEELELAQALAQQATLAIQLTRLAEQTKETAVLQERERAMQEQAAQLSRMNEALQAEVIERQRAERLARGQTETLVKTLTVLAAEPVLNNFLGYVLQAIADQLGDRSGGFYLYSEEHGTTLLHLNYEDGQIQRGAQITHPAALIYPPPKQWDTIYLPQLRQNQILLHDEQELAESPAYDPYRKNNEKRGIKTILVVPLLFEETFLGYTFLRSKQRRDYKPEELELARALAHQATLAIQLTRLAQQAKEAAVLEERNRMAREIHDTLAQGLTGIIVQLQAAEDIDTTDPSEQQGHIAQARLLAKASLAEARRSVRALRPLVLEDTDLCGALAQLVNQMTMGTRIQPTSQVRGTPYALPPDVENNLLRIATEAFTNSLKHARASAIQIELVYERAQVQLRVQDNGCGFDPKEPSNGGFGLLGMRERAQSIGATLIVESRRGRGTTVTVTVPVVAQPSLRS